MNLYWQLIALKQIHDHREHKIRPSDPRINELAVQRICSCITANLLTLNSTRIQFLLVLLQRQLAEIDSCLLDTVAHCARNPRFIYDECLTFKTASEYNYTVCEQLAQHPYSS